MKFLLRNNLLTFFIDLKKKKNPRNIKSAVRRSVGLEFRCGRFNSYYLWLPWVFVLLKIPYRYIGWGHPELVRRRSWRGGASVGGESLEIEPQPQGGVFSKVIVEFAYIVTWVHDPWDRSNFFEYRWYSLYIIAISLYMTFIIWAKGKMD